MDEAERRDRGAFERVTHSDGASDEAIATPFKIHGADIRARGATLNVGEHANEVLEEYGFNSEELAEMAAKPVFG